MRNEEKFFNIQILDGKDKVITLKNGKLQIIIQLLEHIYIETYDKNMFFPILFKFKDNLAKSNNITFKINGKTFKAKPIRSDLQR